MEPVLTSSRRAKNKLVGGVLRTDPARLAGSRHCSDQPEARSGPFPAPVDPSPVLSVRCETALLCPETCTACPRSVLIHRNPTARTRPVRRVPAGDGSSKGPQTVAPQSSRTRVNPL